MRERRFIEVRKLAALDIAFRGRRWALFEFAFSVIFSGFARCDVLRLRCSSLTRAGSPPIYLVLLGLNYVPLLAYAILIHTEAAARGLVSFELEHQDVYRKKYGVQQLLVLVPFSILLLAIFQESEAGPSQLV